MSVMALDTPDNMSVTADPGNGFTSNHDQNAISTPRDDEDIDNNLLNITDVTSFSNSGDLPSACEDVDDEDFDGAAASGLPLMGIESQDSLHEGRPSSPTPSQTTGASLPLMGTDSQRTEHEQPPSSQSNSHTLLSPYDSATLLRDSRWLPRSLHHIYLLLLAVISVALAIVCIMLAAYSNERGGVSNANDTTGFTFTWRFLPTISAVLYTLLWTPIMKDVLRTEPWALLSLPGGSKGSGSLLKSNGFWWMDAIRAIRHKGKAGGIRWPVFIAIFGSMIGSLVINPLSAGLLSVEETTATHRKQFSTIAVPNSPLSPPQINDSIYIRATANLVFNVSTSAWLTDEFAVMPFWPADMANAPLGALLENSPQLWSANTSVFEVQFDCSPLSVAHLNTSGLASPENPDTWNATFDSNDGCTFGLTIAEILGSQDSYSSFAENFESFGGGIWGQLNGSSIACGSRDYIVLYSKNATTLGNQNGKPIEGNLLGQICTTTYLTSNVASNAFISTSSDSILSIDEVAFSTSMRTMDSSFLDGNSFEKIFINATDHLQYANSLAPNSANEPSYSGPLVALGARYNNSLETIMGATDLAQSARVVKQRFFGEVLQAVFSDLADKKTIAKLPASVAETRSRLVVNFDVGIAIGILLMLLAIAALVILFTTRLRRRPLHLESDPDTAMAAALMFQGNTTSGIFEGLDKVTKHQIEAVLHDHTFVIENGKLLLADSSLVPPPTQSSSSSTPRSKPKQFLRNMGISEAEYDGEDWRPPSLRRWAGVLLVLFLASIVAALATIYTLSQGSGLYQSGFVYQDNITLGNHLVTSIAPYSIIPTLIASLVKLWWSALEDAFRRLSPFLAMLQKPRRPSDGVALSYATTPILWITAVAAQRGHWLLALVTLGAFTTEVLQVGMSALWTREPGSLDVGITLTKTLELRSVSHVFTGSTGTSAQGPTVPWPLIVTYLYGGVNYYGSWLFGALVESAYNSSSPSWTKDVWGFPPVDISNIAGAPKVQNSGSNETTTVVFGPPLNVTLNSEALSGRIECAAFGNSSRWILNANLTNSKIWNVTANPKYLHFGYELSSYVRFNGLPPVSTGQPIPTSISIGEWLNYDYNGDAGWLDEYDNNAPSNFTILWVNGGYPQPYVDIDRQIHFIFTDTPHVQALNCMPIFEKANARITINVNNGTIEDYELLDTPRNATEAWDDNFSTHIANITAYHDEDGLGAYNTTVSWGYMFQLALLTASSSEPENTGNSLPIAAVTPFSFLESDLTLDFYSYSALALANNNHSALLDELILTKVSQQVFSTFFKHFISTQNNYDGYWAYQAVNASTPFGLDYEPMQNLTRTYTEEFTTYTITTTAYPTRTSTSTSSSSSTLSSSASSSPASSITVQPFKARHVRYASTSSPIAAATRESSKQIPATLHTRVQVLIVSPFAVFLCISILALLLISTFVIYIAHSKSLKLLPRDVEMPASMLGFVYGSEKLKAWAEEVHEASKLRGHGGSGSKRVARWKMGEKWQDSIDDDVLVGMGYFGEADDKTRWGVEIKEQSCKVVELGEGGES